jgi:Molecular chaperone (small heat shock protein)
MSSLVPRSIFDDFFKDFAPAFYVRPLHGDALPDPSKIKIDVKEDDAAYTVHAEIPGVAKDDIQVSVEGNVVSLRAEVQQKDEKKEGEKSCAPSAITAPWSAAFSCLPTSMRPRPRPNTTTVF